jgi:hypothetical protein
MLLRNLPHYLPPNLPHYLLLMTRRMMLQMTLPHSLPPMPLHLPQQMLPVLRLGLQRSLLFVLQLDCLLRDTECLP